MGDGPQDMRPFEIHAMDPFDPETRKAVALAIRKGADGPKLMRLFDADKKTVEEWLENLP